MTITNSDLFTGKYIGCDTCGNNSRKNRCQLSNPHKDCLNGEENICNKYPNLPKYTKYQYSMWKPKDCGFLSEELFEI